MAKAKTEEATTIPITKAMKMRFKWILANKNYRDKRHYSLKDLTSLVIKEYCDKYETGKI